jgi:hypothetical protein
MGKLEKHARIDPSSQMTQYCYDAVLTNIENEVSYRWCNLRWGICGHMLAQNKASQNSDISMLANIRFLSIKTLLQGKS